MLRSNATEYNIVTTTHDYSFLLSVATTNYKIPAVARGFVRVELKKNNINTMLLSENVAY